MTKWAMEVEEHETFRIRKAGGEHVPEMYEMEEGDEAFFSELVADANRGAEAAAYDKAIDAAANRATDEAFKLTPAALAHCLVRDAIGILAGAPPDNEAPLYQPGRTLQALSKALARLELRLNAERHFAAHRAREVPPQPIEQAIAEALGGLTAEAAEE